MADELAHDFPPLLKVYKDGRLERLLGTDTVPPSTHPQTGVQSKDVDISQHPPVSARLYLPKSATSAAKLPLLIYFHGGGFCSFSSSCPTYHNYLNSLVSEANIVAVSVDYRLAPEHPLPAAYEDSWAALKWVAAHFDGNGPEDWLNRFVDFQRLFFAGDSSGGNIAHYLALKLGSEKLIGLNLIGLVLIHPYFGGTEPVGAKLPNSPVVTGEFWRFAYPSTSGSDDPLFNPAKDPKLGQLGCEKVLVFVAEKDALKDRGYYYAEVLRKSGWKGIVEVVETKGEPHVFHLFNPTSENAVAMEKKFASFLNLKI